MKKDENGEIVKCKARYVAKSFNQVFGRNYLETFAPTAKFSLIRISLAFATHFSGEVFQFDVNSPCVNADSDEDVHIEQSPGFGKPGQEWKLVCKLLRGLHGVKQDGRFWNRTLDEFSDEFGLTRSLIDSCCYFKSGLRENRII